MKSRIVLLVLGSAIALAICEILVRALGLAPDFAPIQLDAPYASFASHPNPKLQYVPAAGAGDINADGFRDRAFAREKPEGTRRIAVIGDSIGFGYCNTDGLIPLEDTFPKVLERELGTGVEVLNFSVSGYDTVQEVEFLKEKALAYEPDTVIVAYSLNDPVDASMELWGFQRDPAWAAQRRAIELYRGLFFQSHLVRFAALRLSSVEVGDETPPRDRTALGFAELERLSKEHGFDTLVVVFPMFGDLDAYPHLAEHGAAAQKTLTHGFDLLDLLPSFRAGASEADVCSPCCDAHPNAWGHTVAAREIARHLRAQWARTDSRSP